MTGRLDQKVAVITGGASGIGLGAVEPFIQEGGRRIVADSQDEKGRMLEQRFEGRVRYQHCDVTREDEIASAIKLAQSHFGGLDILFNNAGQAGADQRIDEIDGAAWDQTFALLVRSTAFGMKH